MTTLIVGSAVHKPRIAYTNLLRDAGATVTASSEVVGSEHQNAYDWLQYTYWVPNAAGASWIKAVFGAPKRVTYFAFFGQTVYANGGTLKLQYSLDAGSTWIDAASVTPLLDAPVYMFFDAILADTWRVLMTSTPASKLGIVSFGEDFECQRGQWVGTVPPVFARRPVVTTMVSNTGAFLGRSKVRSGNAAQLAIDVLTPEWVRTYWLPFQKAIDNQPFFYLHNPLDYPTEAAFCWIEAPNGDMVQCSYTSQRYMNAGFKATARTE